MNDKEFESFTFEEAIEKLEEIAGKLEANTLPLDRALELFKMGVNLVNHCNAKLEEAEGTVEILLKDKEGQLKEMPFNIEHEEGEDEF